MPPVLQRLLVPIDQSNSAAGAVSFALRLARRFGSEVLFCAVTDIAAAIAECSDSAGAFLGTPLVEELQNAAKRLLEETARRAIESGVRATTVLVQGRPTGAIVACAKERAVDAIVMGTQGNRGLDRLLLGSTAEGVLRTTHLPTFVVRNAPGDADVSSLPAFERILVAVDDSDAADATLDFAALLGASGSRMLCCTVVDAGDLLEKAATYGYDAAPFLDDLRTTARSLLESRAARVRESGVDADSILLEGKPVDEILQAAATHRAGLIAIGTHGRRGFERLLLGSVAEGVIRRSPIPVVVLRAPAAR